MSIYCLKTESASLCPRGADVEESTNSYPTTAEKVEPLVALCIIPLLVIEVFDSKSCGLPNIQKFPSSGEAVPSFKYPLFKLVAVDPAVGNTDISVYNATNSHKIEPITIPEFRGALDGPGQYLSFTFEYQEDTTK